MRQLALIALIMLLVASCSGTDRSPGQEAFAPLFPDPELFLAAIGQCRVKPLPQKISGLTVPHHLLAADLMAGAFARVQGQHYRRIIILSPDHFSRSQSPFAVTRRDFETSLGRLATDRPAVNRLLANPLVTESPSFPMSTGSRRSCPLSPIIAPGP